MGGGRLEERKKKGGREQSGYKTIAVGRMISYGSRPPPPPLPPLFLLRKGRSDEKESDISSFFLRWAYKAGETPFPPSSPNVESVCSSSARPSDPQDSSDSPTSITNLGAVALFCLSFPCLSDLTLRYPSQHMAGISLYSCLFS